MPSGRAGRRKISTDKVSFGYKQVSPADKKRLVSAQFDPIARTYDLADALLSLGLHFRWKRAALKLLGLKKGDTVLDLCGGTADLAIKASRLIGPAGRAVVLDFNRPMMKIGRDKARRAKLVDRIAFVQGDAEMTGFPDAAFDAVSVGFGIRNLANLDQGLRETYRLLKNGGRLMILEFSMPRRTWQRALYDFYSFKIMPLGARLICGTAGPFRYLAESIRVFAAPQEVAARLHNAGFRDVRIRPLSLGIAVLYTGRKP